MRRIVLSCVVMLAGLAPAAIAKTSKVRNLDKEHVPGQLIVKFKPGFAEAAAQDMIDSYSFVKMHKFGASQALLLSAQGVIDDETLGNIGDKMLADPRVAYVEANTILRINRMPNDPSFGMLYGLHNAGGTGGRAGADIDAPEAWDVTTGSRNVLVGVIDTGVDYTHPDIAPNYWTNPGESGMDSMGRDKKTNGVDDDMNGYVDDWRGWDFVNNDNDPIDDHNHGTHVSGTIGGSGNDGVGVVGVNWQVSMVGLKFLSGSGSGTLDDAVKAIEYGTKLGVTMTSNSWGGGGYSETMEAAIREAGMANILFIAAAGNDGTDNDGDPHFPSSYELDNVIAVAATDHNDGIAGFSCYGVTSVDLGAPGVDILSTVKAGGYQKYSGTSMATPHVSGAAALVKAAFPNATAAQIKARLMNTADPVASLAGKTVTGARLNAANALETDNVAPNAASELEVIEKGTTSIDMQWQAAGDDDDEGLARRYEVRYAAAPIETDADWMAATKAVVTIADADAAGIVVAKISGLAFNAEGYVAIKATDNVGNVGPLSDSLPFAVLQVRKVYENTSDSLEGATYDMPWGLEDTANGKVFSDSPAADYANDLDIKLALPTVTLESSMATLVVNASWELESGYDFGALEISVDGTTWTKLDEVSGSSGGMQQKSYDLASVLGQNKTFTLRFRLTTDYSIVEDGFKIDGLQIYAPMN